MNRARENNLSADIPAFAGGGFCSAFAANLV